AYRAPMRSAHSIGIPSSAARAAFPMRTRLGRTSLPDACALSEIVLGHVWSEPWSDFDGRKAKRTIPTPRAGSKGSAKKVEPCQRLVEFAFLSRHFRHIRRGDPRLWSIGRYYSALRPGNRKVRRIENPVHCLASPPPPHHKLNFRWRFSFL